MGTVAQSIANIALSFSQAMLTPKDPITWLAFAAAGTASMVSTIAAIKSATSGSYAFGGIVPGNNYSGDNSIVAVNSGELILTKAMQNNLAGQLQNNPLNNLNLSASLSGETIMLAVNAHNRRKGRGEVATTRNKHYGYVDS